MMKPLVAPVMRFAIAYGFLGDRSETVNGRCHPHPPKTVPAL